MVIANLRICIQTYGPLYYVRSCSSVTFPVPYRYRLIFHDTGRVRCAQRGVNHANNKRTPVYGYFYGRVFAFHHWPELFHDHGIRIRTHEQPRANPEQPRANPKLGLLEVNLGLNPEPPLGFHLTPQVLDPYKSRMRVFEAFTISQKI